MCGIAGIFSRQPADHSNTLTRLQEALSHRGPDDSGLWQSPGKEAWLAHTRLSILDLSPGGHQPMSREEGRFTIAFNGEIYNFRELRASLEMDGVAFTSQSDTEVLLALYARRGPSMVRDLRGMFAFAIWDDLGKTAFLARDPFGIKPLYYAERSDGTLFFASELRALRSAGVVGAVLHHQALLRYLMMGSVAEPHTLLADAQCLPAGTKLEWSIAGTRVNRYWSPCFHPNRSLSVGDAVEIAREGLLDSLRHHFISDVPVGIFLSGGIDSTVILALAQKLGHTDLSTFSVGVDDPNLDESEIAAKTARHFNARHHETRLSGSQGATCLRRFMDHIDQPSIDGFNSFVVSEFARCHGMKVILSGLGGDELFGGYPSFQKIPRLLHLGKTIRSVPWAGLMAGRLLECCGRSSRVRRFGSFIRRPSSMLEAYRCFRGIFSLREAMRLAAEFTGQHESTISEELPYPSFEAHDEPDIVSALELTLYMRHQLLRDSDIMSMAHGLELRVPFVDVPLFEALARIPSDHRLGTGKQLLLDAVPEVPPWVAEQPKRGFLFPFEKWMDEDWKETFEEIGRRVPGPPSTWYQRWAIFMLKRWMAR